MGKALSKVGIETTPSGAPGGVKSVDAEFDYRYDNTKALRTNLKGLIKSLNESNSAVMVAPARFVEVGESYMAVNACMNHGGAGGVSQSSHNRAAAATPSKSNASNQDEGPNLSPEAIQGGAGGGGSTKVNRDLAKEMHSSSQAFAESMRKIKEQDYQTYRVGVETDIIKKAETLLAQADATLAVGKEAEAAADKSATAAKKVDTMESKFAKKGTEPTNNAKYTAAVKVRDEEEKAALEKKDAFHESYEALMAATQEFSAQSMDRFMDLNVAYNREFSRAIGASGSPVKGRSAARVESHEPDEP